MALSIHYDVSAREVLTNPDMPRRIQLMKKAGVENLWLCGYFYGRHESAPEQIHRAKHCLENEGFRTGVISLPVGHPGNSLNPDDPDLDLSIHPEWRYRIGRKGQTEYFSACIDEIMTAHNRAAAAEYAQMGFDRHFFDDDLRLGNWGNEVRGCFCDRCIARFNHRTGSAFSRESLVSSIDQDEQVREAWIQYNCDKVTDFMRDTQIPGMISGVMVMHNGGRIHGISIPDIRAAVPGCLFRVGESHFGRDYLTPEGQASLASSVRSHLALIGDNPAFSESTVFPPHAMEPEHWIARIRQEIRLGLRNIFLMSGTWFFSDPYWHALAEALPALKELAAQCDQGQQA